MFTATAISEAVTELLEQGKTMSLYVVDCDEWPLLGATDLFEN